MNLDHIELPCGSTRTMSSSHLQWPGILVEQHTAFAEPADHSTFPYYLLEIAVGTRVYSGERALPHAGFRKYRKAPGMMNFYTEGERPALRPATTTELVVCAFDSGTIAVHAIETKQSANLRSSFGWVDETISRLAMLLADEATQGNPCGRLYAESLSTALIARLFFSPQETSRTWEAKERPGIRRVIDLMHSVPSKSFSLQELAVESGLSRSHFIRAFQEATGRPPHAYLLGLRAERAKELLANLSLRLTDVAVHAGYSSSSDLSRGFRRQYGIAPSTFRNQLSRNGKCKTFLQKTFEPRC